MKRVLSAIYLSFPFQLLLLHFRKFQALLVFWLVLFATVNGQFMKIFGADVLFLAPEYLGNVNVISAAFLGSAVAVFIMSWNISTFILFCRHFRFLATTANPFLKYCINNALLPLAFVVFYTVAAAKYLSFKELLPPIEVIFILSGFFAGLILMLSLIFYYFFRADKSILRKMIPVYQNPGQYITHLMPEKTRYNDFSLLKVKWYMDTLVTVRPVRDVSHYTPDFIENVFKRHHFSAITGILAAFLLLVIAGFFLDSIYFQVPAAASITLAFSILIAVAGAIAYFLQSWSIPFVIVCFVLLSTAYSFSWIDNTNKAYGLNYTNKKERPVYAAAYLDSICNPAAVAADKANMLTILNKWKKNTGEEQPTMIIINTSGGGHRSATFTLKVLQQLDSITHGKIMKHVFLINGASGGMIGAAYFRELYLQKIKGRNINLKNEKYIDDISTDLLNPIFSSMVVRDIFSPVQKFRYQGFNYAKDRGYAFEHKLNANTRNLMDKPMKDYRNDEKNANIPLMFFGSVITRDSRKLLISTQPIRFMMRPVYDSLQLGAIAPDVVDFNAFFSRQSPQNLRVLTALRMNATFPAVLPNVWLPSSPVIDVMDAGLRDNYGVETTIRFMQHFDEWIGNNCSKVILVQIKDRASGGWEQPFDSDNLGEILTKPFLILQYNWFKMMEYEQNDLTTMYSNTSKGRMFKINFEYSSGKKENKASLNFRISRLEKKDILLAVGNKNNTNSFNKLQQLLQPR